MIKVDVIFNYFVALIIPKLIFLILKWTSTSKSPNLVATSLKDASLEMGMEEGIGVFVFLGLISYKLSEYIMYSYYASKIKKDQMKKGLLYDDVLRLIDSYAISNRLRTILKSKYIIRNY